MISPLNFASLYDFTDIETAVQSYFVSTGAFAQPPDEDDPARDAWEPGTGETAVFTVRESALFQKHTPRVMVLLNHVQPSARPMKQIADGNGALRNHLWSGSLTFGMVTKPNYKYHLALRQAVHALCEMIAPPVLDQTILLGANQYLSKHIITTCINQQVDFNIEASGSFFGSQLEYQITFGTVPGLIEAVT